MVDGLSWHYYNKDPERVKLELATLQAKRYGKRKILICN